MELWGKVMRDVLVRDIIGFQNDGKQQCDTERDDASKDEAVYCT